ncbi:hypothetical protein HDU85_000416 [Gaertneriomyces sp. JEL0708]|nr:hypothetical protein HDU85_000416 [Gaertneriomyces sp. JEL0708]
MSTPTTATTPTASKSRSNPHSKASKPKLKLVVRRLPPTLPEPIFASLLTSYLPQIEHHYYVPGKSQQKKSKPDIYSRGYVAFKSVEPLYEFYNQFNGHVFISKSKAESVNPNTNAISGGNEGGVYKAVVELAPFQRIPRKRKKADARMGTIEQDTDYMAFVNSLREAESGATNEKGEIISTGTSANALTNLNLNAGNVANATETNGKPVSTPLLDALRAKKAKALEANALRRQNMGQTGKKNKRELHASVANGATSSSPTAAGTANTNAKPHAPATKNRVPGGKNKNSVSSATSAKGNQDSKGDAPNPKSKRREKEKESDKERGDKAVTIPNSMLFKASIGAIIGGPNSDRGEASESKGRGYKHKRQQLAAEDSGSNTRDKPPSRRGRKGTPSGGSNTATNSTAITSATGSNNAPQQQKKSGPNVVIMKRDGTTTNFVVGE